MKSILILYLLLVLFTSAHPASLYLTGQVPQKLKFLWRSGQMYLESNNPMPLRVRIHKRANREVASVPENEKSYVVISGELFSEKDLKNVEKIVIEAP